MLSGTGPLGSYDKNLMKVSVEGMKGMGVVFPCD